MKERDRVLHVIYAAVDELNRLLPPEQRLKKSEETRLTGVQANLDSLGFLNLVLLTEEKVAEHFDRSVSLVENLAANDEIVGLEALGTLADLITSLLEEAGHE